MPQKSLCTVKDPKTKNLGESSFALTSVLRATNDGNSNSFRIETAKVLLIFTATEFYLLFISFAFCIFFFFFSHTVKYRASAPQNLEIIRLDIEGDLTRIEPKIQDGGHKMAASKSKKKKTL